MPALLVTYPTPFLRLSDSGSFGSAALIYSQSHLREDMSSNEGYRAKILPILTRTVQYTTPFISVFLLVHLSAPALANVGGSSLASQTMLLGREYYQTALSEPLLVLGPIGIHAASATLKRLLSPSGQPPRRLTHPVSVTGYATLFFLTIHYLTHRYYPALDIPPIDSLGPAELDYEFVKAALRTWPIRSWLLYGGLVFFSIMHVVDGGALVRAAWVQEGRIFASFLKKQYSRRKRLALALGGVVLPVMTGVYALANEPSMTFASMTTRYLSVFRSSFAYRL
ncbi:unnamed protein product [Cyclocybe aegerita]|uniref:Mitochondrial adapter protein MCP1 transmembrane domain-containing protein n=1 Tax=Cyclocybe aegerita TaxID=1973307 RepID=A0A8S0W0G5_CYCAE|nr:unnamed protein product [Cyclocybe aegerita]